MDKPEDSAKAPQLDRELEKRYRKYSPFVLGTFPPSEYRAILKYLWNGPSTPPEPPDK